MTGSPENPPPGNGAPPRRGADPARLGIAILDGFRAFSQAYDVVLCDVWGVLHDGLSAFPDAGEALSRYREGGGRVVLVSNAPRPGFVVSRQLDELGVPREAYDAIVTSGDLTRAFVAARGAETLFHLGPERDIALFRGLDATFGGLGEAGYVVCTGLFDDETETVADYQETLAEMRRRDLLMVCANPDLVVERGDRLILCAGALAAAYDAMGGKSFAGGKPHRPIYEAALGAAEEALGRAVPPARVIGIGDAIRTDVAGARAFGIDALLIARGIHAKELGAGGAGLDADMALAWLAEQDFRPTAIAPALVWE